MKYGPSIVTNGCILALDAADKNSYSGSDTNWRDLSGNRNDGTLINGVQFSSDYGGSMSFVGKDVYSLTTLSCTDNFGSSSFTWITWTYGRFISGAHNMPEHGYGSGGWPRCGFYCYADGSMWRFWSYSSAGSSSGFSLYNYNTSPTSWNMLTAVIDRENTISKAYTNNVLSHTLNSVPDNLAGNDDKFGIGRSGSISSTWNANWEGSVGNFLIYNRALSEKEIISIYNTTKSRFGL